MATKPPLESVRHSLAHLLSAAVLELWPGTKNTLGPSIENGFYYDFDVKGRITDEDLPKIEKKMLEILKTWKEFSGKKITAEEAKKFYKDNEYKKELVDDIVSRKEDLTLYTSGEYVDLCRGGHVKDAKEIRSDAFTLTHIAGAYWRGDEKNKQLTRVYGLAFNTKKELESHQAMLKEAKKRDHKVLGPALDLFTFSDMVGAGLPLWTPKGTLLRNILDEKVWQLRKKHGYERVEIPHITKKELYITSGHWEKFKDDLFRIKTREGHEFAMKPMNCPHHTQIYARKQWSYRELPQRYANTTMCYRDEQTGELSGLSRARSFTQDDAHVFCRMSQAKEEFLKIWDIVHEFYKIFEFDLTVRVSLHDPKNPKAYLGDKTQWMKAEKMLKDIVSEKKSKTIEGHGEAAFYGPKLDFLAKDSLGREWQVATIQLDMSMPESFDLTCINEKGEKERIVMIHAAIMGSLERFLSIAIEHFAGAFPLWLSPVQIAILPITDKQNEYAKKVSDELQNNGFRVDINFANETIGRKIRSAEVMKIPYLLVIGGREEDSKAVAVRKRGEGDTGAVPIDAFLTKLKKELLLK